MFFYNPNISEYFRIFPNISESDKLFYSESVGNPGWGLYIITQGAAPTCDPHANGEDQVFSGAYHDPHTQISAWHIGVPWIPCFVSTQGRNGEWVLASPDLRIFRNARNKTGNSTPAPPSGVRSVAGQYYGGGGLRAQRSL